jgi:hypothetical protein
VYKARKGFKDSKESRVMLASKVHKVVRVHKVFKEHRGSKVM